jgi:NADPH-dependent curcumin reductase CurA
MSDLQNRRIVLAMRPEGIPGDECWTLLEGEPVREPGPGEVLVEVEYLSIDPALPILHHSTESTRKDSP